MPTISTRGTERPFTIFKDWGARAATWSFSHGWPLSADAFEDLRCSFSASRGLRCIAHDRRGHGRSSQPWSGNEMDTYADDLAEFVEALDSARRGPRSGIRPVAARWRATSDDTAPVASRRRC